MTKVKGANEAYRDQALDAWKMEKCCNASCKECSGNEIWQFHNTKDCGGRYAI